MLSLVSELTKYNEINFMQMILKANTDSLGAKRSHHGLVVVFKGSLRFEITITTTKPFVSIKEFPFENKCNHKYK